MLYEEVEAREREARGGIITATGTCRFCGQVATRKALEEWGQEEIDELITESCDCIDSGIYANKKRQREQANEKIELLFGAGNKTVEVPEEAVNLFYKAVYLMCEGVINGITIDIGDGITGKISITQKGTIKVVRTKTDKSVYEA